METALLCVYLLWVYEYCEICNTTHQIRHCDTTLTSVFLSRAAALQFLLQHPRYVDDHEEWCWLIEEWHATPALVEGPGALVSPFWRSFVEVTEATHSQEKAPELPIRQPPGWPYRWQYSRTGVPQCLFAGLPATA